MKTLTKTFLGAALLAGSVLAVSAPANAQPDYHGYGDYGRQNDGYGSYGRGYNDYGRYDGRTYRGGIRRDTRHCTSPRFGQWRYDTLAHRRMFVPYRWAVRGGYLRDCMYTMSRTTGVWYRF